MRRKISSLLSALDEQLGDLGAQMLDNPRWIRGFIWFVLFCAFGTLITQVAVKLGYIR